MQMKLNGSMDIQQIIMTMSEGNSEAEDVLMIMMKNKDLYMHVLTCDKLGIRGVKLVKLYYYCCNGETDKMVKTIEMFKNGVFTEEDINTNLSLAMPEVFLDETIVGVHIPLYSKEFKPGHPEWDEFAYLQKRNLILKLKKDIM